MAKEIYLIRHGLTESNKKKIYSGWSKEELCLEGITTILDVGRKIKKFEIEKIFSSPIRRAAQTAWLINGYLRVSIEWMDDLKEMKMGLWEGLSENEVAHKFPEEWRIWNLEPSKLSLKGRESLEDLKIRALQAMEKISKDAGCLKALVVTHVSLIRVLMIHFNKWNIDRYRKIVIPNGGIYSLADQSGKKEIVRVL